MRCVVVLLCLSTLCAFDCLDCANGTVLLRYSDSLLFNGKRSYGTELPLRLSSKQNSHPLEQVAHFVTQMIQQGKLGKKLVASVVEKRGMRKL